jgi:hypothetical protein
MIKLRCQYSQCEQKDFFREEQKPGPLPRCCCEAHEQAARRAGELQPKATIIDPGQRTHPSKVSKTKKCKGHTFPRTKCKYENHLR